jgi:hypothetical protein
MSTLIKILIRYYTESDTEAVLDHDAYPYLEKSSFNGRVKNQILRGKKTDWAGSLGVTQILNKSALIEGSVSYTNSSGYMSNPYKAVEILFIDPNQTADEEGKIDATMRAFLENRPEKRQQWIENLRYVQHIDALDAALHLDYRFYHDDWDIQAHTISGDWIQPLGDGWSITPRVRYYSQNAANFYAPYLVSKQSEKYDTKLLPKNYSSDARLSGYGALSGGVTINKKFAKGLELQAGAEYYTHEGGLKLGITHTIIMVQAHPLVLCLTTFCQMQAMSWLVIVICMQIKQGQHKMV